VALTFVQEAPGGPIKTQDTYTWGSDPVGRPFVSTVVSTLDSGTAAVTKQTVQTVDQYGNLLTQQVYNYGTAGSGSAGSLARTYTNTYLTDASGSGTFHPFYSTYGANYIFNRVTQSTVTDGTNTATTAYNTYDLTPVTTVTGMPAHDSTYGTSFVFRGNATTVDTLTTGGSVGYDIGGNVTTSTTNGVTTSTNTSTNSATNYAAPSLLTTNSLSTSLTWSGFLGLTSSKGPNGDVASVIYDGAARPSSSTSPTGAVTTYSYAISGLAVGTAANWATTNGHWVQTQLDGFGRTIHSITGYGTGTGTTVSEVDTVYAPCGCSPMGKVSQVSQPYVTANTQQWTTYAYDVLGRTLSVTLPDTSNTSYSYSGNTVTVTDAASHSKTFTMDVFGNLISVQETDPTLKALVTTSYTYDVLNHLISVSMPRTGQTTALRRNW
jgi:YD repeat-containing protein